MGVQAGRFQVIQVNNKQLRRTLLLSRLLHDFNPIPWVAWLEMNSIRLFGMKASRKGRGTKSDAENQQREHLERLAFVTRVGENVLQEKEGCVRNVLKGLHSIIALVIALS
jgi:hypothetical protein